MYLDYSKLAFDKNGTPETPTLVLKTMHEETIGVIPGVYNLKLSVKFAEPSEMTFDVPAILDGEKNWIYDELVGYKVIYTEHYGIYVVMNPTTIAEPRYQKNRRRCCQHCFGRSWSTAWCRAKSGRNDCVSVCTGQLYQMPTLYQVRRSLYGRLLRHCSA